VFTAEVVARVRAADEEEMVARLSSELDRKHRLIRAQGLLRRDGQRLSRYRFRHILFQKYLYNKLDRVERVHLHEGVGTALEDLYGEGAEEIAVQLARHFEAAGVLDKATACRLQAGNKAVRLSANEAAIAHFTQGLALLENLPDTPQRAQQELMLQISLSAPLVATRGYAAPEVGRVCARARELCKQVGEMPQLFSVVFQLFQFYGVRAEYETALDLLEQNLSLAERAEDPVLVAMTHWGMGYCSLFRGELTQALDQLEHVIAFYDPQQHHALAYVYGLDPGVACLSWSSWLLWLLGYPDQALKRRQEVLALAEELSHPHSLAAARGVTACLHHFRREPEAAQASAEPTIALSTEHGFPLWLTWMTFLHGWALAEQGQDKEGIAQMRDGMTAYLALGMKGVRPMLLAQLAEAHARVGQIEEGSQLVAEALGPVERTGERYYQAEIHRLKGELLLVQGDEAQAEASFDEAIEVARQQGAKSWELRATVSLCRLFQEQGKQEEARPLLREIYGWFTEGFDTPDLIEGKALLEELS
jgi:predicted ATPase